MEHEEHEELLSNIDFPASLLSESNNAEISKWCKTPRFNHRRLLYSLVAGTALLTVFVSITMYLLYNWYFQTTQKPSMGSHNSTYNCGASPTEARELGCKFDIMMNGWVPLACYNEALSEEYLSKNNFHFYTDAYAQDEVPMDVLRKGEWEGLYTGWEHHILHCAYMWKILVLAIEAGKGMFDSSSSSFAHTAHCSESMFESDMIMVMMQSESVGNESFIQPGFLSCGQPIRSKFV